MNITLPSGREVDYTRPPRRVFWRHGRIGQTFQVKVNEIAKSNEGMSAAEQGLLLLESLSEDESRRFQAFADDLVRHATNEDPDTFEELDYFTVVGKVLYSIPGATIETKEGAASVEDVENFSSKRKLSKNRKKVSHVRAASV